MNIIDAYRAMLSGKKVGRIASSHSSRVDRELGSYLCFNGRHFVFKRQGGGYKSPTDSIHSRHEYEILGDAEEFRGERSDFESSDKLHVLSKYDIDKEDLDILLERSS